MKTELSIYVTKELLQSGQTSFFFKNNESSHVYQFPVDELPVKENESDYHNGFGPKMRDLLRIAGVTELNNMDYKVSYNREYKSSGKTKLRKPKNKSLSYELEKQLDEIPMEGKEIIHFMKLFGNF